VGPDFQPTSGHETKYYYGKPTQESLDRLFGPEAGNASHFLKNMVQDANGQLSVSYVNSSGKTIATALAGNTPFNVQSLESNVLPQVSLQQLLGPTDFSYDAPTRSLKATATFLLSVASQPELRINLQPALLKVATSQGDLCHTCVYRLKVVVRDFCNNIVGSIDQSIGTISNSCANPASLQPVVALKNGTENLAPGEYAANIEIITDEKAIDFYTESHLTNNKDIKSINFFLLEQLKNTDFTDCYNSCNSCAELTKVSQQKWVESFNTLYQQENLVMAEDDKTYLEQLYLNLIANCNAISNCNVSEPTGPCDDLLSLMIPDVEPGGQYALYDSTSFELLETGINVIAKRSQVVWKDNNGFDIRVLNDNGQLVSPKDLSVKEFIEKFQPEWARLMVKLHPEYCYYEFCMKNSVSEDFDKKIQQEYDADKARDRGWFGSNSLPVTNDWLLSIDPFFNNQNGVIGLGAAYKSQMAALLDNYSATEVDTRNISPVKGILNYIQYELYCKDPNTGFSSASWQANCNVTESCRSPYMEWMMYKNNYLSLKSRFVEMVRVDSSQCNACYIGTNPLPPVTNPSIPIGGGTLPTKEQYEVIYSIDDPFQISERGTRELHITAKRIDDKPLNCDVLVKGHISEFVIDWYYDIPFSINIPAGSIDSTITRLKADAFGPLNIVIESINTTDCSNQSVIVLPSPSGSCTSNPLYLNKIRRVIPYLNGDGISFSGTTNISTPDQQQELSELVQSRADAILAELSSTATCAIPANSLSNLRSSLLPLLTQTITVHNPLGNSTNGSLSFQDMFTQQIGAITSVDCSPYLVSMFYPLNYQPSLQTREIIQTDNAICTRINALIQASGIPANDYLELHKYFKAKFTSSYTLTDQQLIDLIQSCNSCSPARYLEKPLKLPIFFESDRVTLSKSAFQQLVNEFHALHQITSGNLAVESQKDKYALAFTNYINYKTGFSLAYSDYIDFANDPLAQELINRYVTPETDELVSSCVADLFLNATASAAFTHKRYIDSI
ncbi:MAG: hypothetical protein ACK52I_18725, partial [Pseudomonadota bacterium]